MITFTDISQEFCLDFKPCIHFQNFQIFFIESHLITGYHSGTKLLCNGLYMRVETAATPHVSTRPTHLQIIFHRKQLNTTKVN